MAVPAAGDTIRASDIFTINDYTPTLSNVTPGTGSILEGWYQQIGELVIWSFRLELGTSPSFSTSASVLVSLPVTADTGGGTGLQATIGAWTLRTDTTIRHYSGSMGCFESAGINACFNGAWSSTDTRPAQRMGGFGGTVFPQGITLVATNVLSGSGQYRATS